MNCENSQSLLLWLRYCEKHSSDPHGEVMFDENGMMHPTAINFGVLPFSAEQSWTLFQDANSAEFLKAFAGDDRHYYRFQISDRGLAFVQTNYRSWLQNQTQRLVDNTLSILLAVVVTLACQWALALIGPGGEEASARPDAADPQ